MVLRIWWGSRHLKIDDTELKSSIENKRGKVNILMEDFSKILSKHVCFFHVRFPASMSTRDDMFWFFGLNLADANN